MSIRLLDIIKPECIRVPLVAKDKHGAIDELVDLLVGAGKVTAGQSLKDAVWQREVTRTTGIGHGLAIPHGKCNGVESIAIAIGKPAEPMEFQAIDSRPVRLIILLASPTDKTSDHIQALAHISRLMTMEEFRHRMYAANSADEIVELLRSQETRPA
jgi:fructose-specific phosphotransferase system IIA component